MADLLEYFKTKQSEIEALLKHLVEHETFSTDKAAIDTLADTLVDAFTDMQADSVTRIPMDRTGDIVIGKWREDADGTPIMLLVHMDTVWPAGTLAKRPVMTDDEGRMFGPGILDMKGGIAVAMSAIKGLVERDELPDRPIWLMCTGDEEIGSVASEAHIRNYARQVGLVMVMEPPAPDGALKTGRKGVAKYSMTITGRAAHAGNHPEQGINAILEMAQQTVAINRLQDLRNGISVAVTTIQGGTASNVIPASVTAEIDVRTFTQHDMDRIHDELTELLPKIPGAKIDVRLHHLRGPMERSQEIIAVFEQARAIGASLGLTIHDEIVGGASDANITASLGIPTLDGLGPRGEGLHADHEHVILDSLPERAAHLAAILRDWQFT